MIARQVICCLGWWYFGRIPIGVTFEAWSILENVFIWAFLDSKLVALVDWGSLQVAPGTFIDARTKAHGNSSKPPKTSFFTTDPRCGKICHRSFLGEQKPRS